MNFTPIALLSIAPAATLVTQGAAQLAQTGRDFAGYLLNASTTSSDSPSDAGNGASIDPKLKALLEPLRKYLAGQGFSSEDRLELVTNGSEPISVEAEPFWKESVQDWIRNNPDWQREWQKAVSAVSPVIPSRNGGLAAYGQDVGTDSLPYRTRVS